MLREAEYYTRMMMGVYRVARAPVEPDPQALIQRMLDNRERNFLDLVRQVVFSNPSNPYYALFQWAGCTYGDLEHAVKTGGLEPTLESLRENGVYLAHDEFKGSRPIVRSGRQLPARPTDFNNPLVRGLLESTSGGTRSNGTNTWRSLEFLNYREAQTMVMWGPFGLAHRPIVGIRSILPADGGMRMALNFGRRQVRYDKWFALGGAFQAAGHYRTVLKFLLLEARLLGVPVLFPYYLPHNDFSPVARWLARRCSEGVKPIFWSNVSQGARVAAAAADAGLDISGTTCIVGSEPLTEAKREAMRMAGCDVHNRYGVSELGQVGVACPEMKSGEVHICRDTLAVISYRRTAPLTDVEIESLMFTTVLPWSPLCLINVEMDDSARLEPARCHCSLKAMGFSQQASQIYSYGRLTGQGMTLVGGDVLKLLEIRLPQRFGGTSTDYQLVERDGPNQTEIELRVHPQVGARSAEEVKEFFLSELKAVYGGGLTQRNWRHSEGLRVVFAAPYMSIKQRVQPLHLIGTTQRQRGEAAVEGRN